MARTHIVKTGDTLGRIAAKYYGKASLYKKLAEYNGIKNPNVIRVGIKLEIPSESVLLKGRLAPGPKPSREPADHGIVRPRGLTRIIETFGDIRAHVASDGTLKASWGSTHMGRVLLPFAIPLSWAPDKKVKRLYCHKKLGLVFKAVFDEIVEKKLVGKIVSFGGCFNYRLMRRSYKLSTHSWGIAIDLNVKTNLVGTPGDMDPLIVEIFKRHGFIWGGDWSGSRCDPMHFQFCEGY